MKHLFTGMAAIALACMAMVAEAQPKQRSEKRGVAEEQFTYAEEIDALAPGVCWTYNWGTAPNNLIKELFGTGEGKKMEYLPMAWNRNANIASIKNIIMNTPTVSICWDITNLTWPTSRTSHRNRPPMRGQILKPLPTSIA